MFTMHRASDQDLDTSPAALLLAPYSKLNAKWLQSFSTRFVEGGKRIVLIVSFPITSQIDDIHSIRLSYFLIKAHFQFRAKLISPAPSMAQHLEVWEKLLRRSQTSRCDGSIENSETFHRKREPSNFFYLHFRFLEWPLTN